MYWTAGVCEIANATTRSDCAQTLEADLKRSNERKGYGHV